MTEIMACVVGCAIGAFFVGVIIVAFIAVINSNICSSDSKEEDGSSKTELDHLRYGHNIPNKKEL